MVKAVLVGVSDYSKNSSCNYDLPYCRNDIFAIQKSLVNGLNVNVDDINLLGANNSVTIKDLETMLNNILCDNYETFIFYFSGHGGKNILCLSDSNITIENLIDVIGRLNFKNKVIILDSCHSGSFDVEQQSTLDINQTVDSFIGHGYAVLASCGANETSGFRPNKRISLYTSFICDALQFKSTIRKGRKTLESIQETVYYLGKIWNENNSCKIQQPIFRENIGGTIYFNVDEYVPYEKKQIFEETEDYIIYEVDPVHTSNTKRYSLKVILRQMYDIEKMSEISMEIINKAKYFEVFANEISESSKKDKIANIIWCYFGYDESDIINGRYFLKTTWVDDLQNKDHWYRLSKNSFILNNIHFDKVSYYSLLKSLQTTKISR